MGSGNISTELLAGPEEGEYVAHHVVRHTELALLCHGDRDGQTGGREYHGRGAPKAAVPDAAQASDGRSEDPQPISGHLGAPRRER